VKEIGERKHAGRMNAIDTTIKRKVYVKKGERAFCVEDTLESRGDSEYMLLYHPCFPVENGTRFTGNANVVVSRDSWADIDIEKFDLFERVGEGSCSLFRNTGKICPTKPEDNIEKAVEENFERCYAMTILADGTADVYAALLNEDNGVYIRHNLFEFGDEQLAFQFWKNPVDGCAGLEVGSTFMGKKYAEENNLMSHLKKGERRTHKIKIGFLKGKEEVDDFIKEHKWWRMPPVTFKSKEKKISELYVLR